MSKRWFLTSPDFLLVDPVQRIYIYTYNLLAGLASRLEPPVVQDNSNPCTPKTTVSAILCILTSRGVSITAHRGGSSFSQARSPGSQLSGYLRFYRRKQLFVALHSFATGTIARSGGYSPQNPSLD